MRLARERGANVLALTNVMGSQATRDADSVLFTRAGLEIGVAATKTFTSQVAAMYLLGLWLAQARERAATGADGRADRRDEGAAARDRGDARNTADQVRAIARSHYEGRFFLYLGRHIGLPVCLEGALKMKEISYIPSDAYAAGEMKHGPIALLDESTPVVCVATDRPVLDKVLSNMAEVRARGADVIAIATEGSEHVAEAADQTLFVAAHRLDPAADPRGAPAAAARLPHGPHARTSTSTSRETWRRPSRSSSGPPGAATIRRPLNRRLLPDPCAVARRSRRAAACRVRRR